MRNFPVHWYEGMFLRPHQFQAAERHFYEHIQTSEQWDHQYNYGLRSVQISPEAIANYQVQLGFCNARLKDGTLVALEAGQEPDRVSLKEAISDVVEMKVSLEEAFESASAVRVYLAVPKLRMGRANVGPGGDGETPRFSETTQSVQDESAGGNDQDIQFRLLNARLLLSTQDLSGYELLPVAQIARATEGEATPKVDDDYFPPVLAIDAWPPLGRGIVRAVYDILGKKIEVLSDQILSRGMTLASSDPGDLERLIMLMVLNQASAVLHVLTFAHGVHPFVAYTELVRIVGQLSIFHKNRQVPEIPNYDHDDLARIFKWAKKQIEDLINTIRGYEYEKRDFIGAGKGMQVTLEPKWFNADWSWYVGVDPGNLPEKECRELLSAGALDWKMGSSQQVDTLFKFGAPGVHLEPVAQTPRALPAGGGWIYYQVSRDNAAWKDVQVTQTLAMRFKEELITNMDMLQGQKKLQVSARGKNAVLQFSLFAVPRQR